MNKNRINWSVVGLFIALLLCDTLAQLFFKQSVIVLGEFPTAHYYDALNYLQKVATSYMAIAGVTMLLCAFFVWIAIISIIDLSKAHPLTCLVFATVAISSSLIFDEAFSARQAIGVFLIVAGAYITSEHQ